jgi:hypothetical protein
MRKTCKLSVVVIPAQSAPIAYNYYDQLNHIHQCIHHLESKKDFLLYEVIGFNLVVVRSLKWISFFFFFFTLLKV